MTNMIVDWAHTCKTVQNMLACWVCSPLLSSNTTPLSIRGLWLWLIGPGNAALSSESRRWLSGMRQSMWSYRKCRNEGACLAPKENIYYGMGFPGWLWVLNYGILNPCMEKRDGTELSGWILPSLCANVSIDQGYREANSVTPVPHSILWVCGSYRWPYLHGSWTWQCPWGRPHILALIYVSPTLTCQLGHSPCMVPSKQDPLVILFLDPVFAPRSS